MEFHPIKLPLEVRNIHYHMTGIDMQLVTGKLNRIEKHLVDGDQSAQQT